MPQIHFKSLLNPRPSTPRTPIQQASSIPSDLEPKIKEQTKQIKQLMQTHIKHIIKYKHLDITNVIKWNPQLFWNHNIESKRILERISNRYDNELVKGPYLSH